MHIVLPADEGPWFALGRGEAAPGLVSTLPICPSTILTPAAAASRATQTPDPARGQDR